MICKLENKYKGNVQSFFDWTEDTLVKSCIQGVMGEVFTDSIENPKVVCLKLDVFYYIEGDETSKAADELLESITGFALIITESDRWKNKLKAFFKDRCSSFLRYSFYKDKEHLNLTHVERLVSGLTEGYELKKIDKNIALMESLNNLSEAFTGNFHSVDDFLDRGIGYVIIHNGEVVAGASSYSVYNGGIEIEVCTNIDYREKGLATIVSAALIAECLKNNIYPSWDAANLKSVKLAEKLGYIMNKPYETYLVN